MQRPTQLTAGILFLVCTSTALLVWWNLGRVSADNDPNAYMIKMNVPVYESLPSTPLSDYDSTIVHFLSTNVFNTKDGHLLHEGGHYPLALTRRLEELHEPVYTRSVSDEQIESLLTQAAELVYYRLLQSDHELYMQSRINRKALVPSEERLKEIGWGDVGPMVEYYLDRPSEPDDTTGTIISESFNWWKDKTSIHDVESFADGPDGLLCSLGLIDSTHEVSVDLYTSKLGVEGWSGAAPQPSGVFLFPTKTADELLEAYGALPYAMLGTVVNYKNADPQAIVFVFMWNPDIQDWHLMSALFVNRKNQDARYLPHF